MTENDILTADEILAHPRFDDARAAHLDALVALFRADRFASRMMSDAGVILVRGFLVALHMGIQREDRSTWATTGNIQQALVKRGLASPRRIDDLLARFRQAGYVTQTDAPGDRRVRILQPTPQLIRHDREHLAAYHKFLLVLTPGRGYEWVLGDDENAHRTFRLASLQNLGRATSAVQNEAMRLFLARDAGYLALILVANSQLSGESGPTWASMSDDLGVSRAHLRSIFAAAETAGYARFNNGRRRPIDLQPLMWQAYNRFLADIQADQDAIAQISFKSSW